MKLEYSISSRTLEDMLPFWNPKGQFDNDLDIEVVPFDPETGQKDVIYDGINQKYPMFVNWIIIKSKTPSGDAQIMWWILSKEIHKNKLIRLSGEPCCD